VEGRTNLFSFFENSRFCRSDSETKMARQTVERIGTWKSVKSIILF